LFLPKDGFEDKKDFSLLSSVAIKEFNFSFDELLQTIEEKIAQGGAKAVTEYICNWLSVVISDNYSETVLPKLETSCCNTPYWLRHGKTQKTMQTSFGKLNLNLQRMKCHNCHTTHNPFNIFFDLKDRRHSYELEMKAVTVLADQSYRRTCKHLSLISGSSLTKNQLHRIVLSNDLKKQDLKIKNDLQVLAADGTGYKPHSEDSKQELKIVMGIDSNQKLIPIGAWIRSSWAQIGREIKKANHPNKKLAFKPVANILLSDGDRNLIKGLKPLTLHQQRCQWHFVRDFKYAYKYHDKGDDAEAKRLTNELWDMIQRVEPKNMNLENTIPDEATLKILAEVKKAEKELEELEIKLKKENLNSAAVYVHNARFQLFNHLRVLLKSGEEVAKVTSRVERFMRELGRRLKRIAHNWSEAGAEIMARILLKKTLDPKGWDDYWKEKMKISGNIELNVKIVHST
jgi:hypothetical protein